MTCVIGYKTEKGIWIGADSAGTTEFGQQTLRGDTKVFRRHGMTFGFCGSFRMGQLLRFGLYKIEHPVGMDDFEYMVTKFIEDVRATLRVGGYTHIKDNEESGGDFLVAYRNELYQIEPDFQVALSTRAYTCIGSGADVAFGAMHALADWWSTPPVTVKRALSAAADHDAYVSPPFVVVKHKP
jgi:ATP-dependent protease HslVU (ClpYQ) peptidase subunit